MDQAVINWVMGGFGTLVGFVLNVVWQAVKDLQAGERALTEKLGGVEVLVAGDYMKKDDHLSSVLLLLAKLDRMEDKLDKKVDK